MSPFDISNELSFSGKDNWENIEDKDYVPFMINRAFSYHTDTVMLANEMNMRHSIPVKWQYDFYRIAIQPKRKRFSKWAKPEEDSLIDLISETYNVNKSKAIQIRSLLSDKDIVSIKESTFKGGR